MAEPLWRRVLFPRRRGAALGGPRVLALTSSATDQAFYRSLKARGQWDMEITQSVPEALRMLSAGSFSIVVFDREFPGWDWRDLLVRIVERSPRSCCLLASRVSDEYLWREVVARGGYDVVTKPLADPAVSLTLQRAWYYWKTESPPMVNPSA